MKLIFLYGPPGVGKLTVAKELSKLIGFPVFHNHLTVDLAHAIFPFGTPAYSKLVEKIRLDLFEAAARSKMKGLIFTFVYGVESFGGKKDDAMVKKFVRSIEKNKGQVLFVKLGCETQELYKRIKQPSRKKFKKIKSVKLYKSIQKKINLTATIPFGDGFIIDNTRLPAHQTALAIQQHYKLRP